MAQPTLKLPGLKEARAHRDAMQGRLDALNKQIEAAQDALETAIARRRDAIERAGRGEAVTAAEAIETEASIRDAEAAGVLLREALPAAERAFNSAVRAVDVPINTEVTRRVEIYEAEVKSANAAAMAELRRLQELANEIHFGQHRYRIGTSVKPEVGE